MRRMNRLSMVFVVIFYLIPLTKNGLIDNVPYQFFLLITIMIFSGNIAPKLPFNKYMGLGFLFWYLIANNWTQPTINTLVLIMCILVAGNGLLALYKIPEQWCTNPYIEQLLNFPIKVSQIIYTVIFRLCKIQILIYVCFILPYILFFYDEFSLTISCGLICTLLSMIFDCLIFLLMIGIPFISLMILCCAINTISSTSYSSDKNIQYYKFFPINYARVFFAKVVVGFLWNEIIVSFIWIISSIGNGLSFDISLLIFGTFTNLLTSAIGVYFDYKMPRNINGSNLLFHGNINKIFVLLAIVGLTILGIYLL